jgi:trimethylamine corrinoid protein
MSEEEIIVRLEKAVVEGDVDATKAAATQAAMAGLDPLDTIERGLARGVRTVGERFGKGELFITDLMAAAEAMRSGLNILQPLLMQRKEKMKTAGRIVIGTVAGDIHDIGKSIVASMLIANQFEVTDLGVDVPNELFVNKVKELQPDILGLSALMTTTMQSQKDVLDALRKSGIRAKVRVMLGGAVTGQDWAREIGADSWASDAAEAAAKAKELLR